MNNEELDELMMDNDDFLFKGFAQDDVADIIDRHEDLQEMVADLKEYFDLDARFYEERALVKTIMTNSK